MHVFSLVRILHI